MAMNVLNVGGELIGIIGGALILIIFSVTFAPWARQLAIPRRRSSEAPAAQESPKTQLPKEDLDKQPVLWQDYIQGFTGEVYGGSGRMPLVVTIFSIGLSIWWGVYLVTNWSQYLWSVRTFFR